jgi:parallel beta-helix repeat protein
MHASGTIENNLVYENDYAGIRVGDGVLSGMTISHNTVVDNGGGTTPERSGAGGGIVYHDGYAQDGSTPCYYCRPYGTIPSNINVKDNVIAYSAKPAFPGMGLPNTAAVERDYNLIYSNSQAAWFMSADCGYPDFTGSIDFICVNGQYGFGENVSFYTDQGNANCIASLNPYPCCEDLGKGTCLGDGKLKLVAPNDILADPLFENRANDDYRLKVLSPGSGCASDESNPGYCDGSDRGAWGGSYPIDW